MNRIQEISIMAMSHIADAATYGSIPLMCIALDRWPAATLEHGFLTAVCVGNFEMVKWMINCGVNVNVRENGKSALYWVIAGDGYSVFDERRCNPPEEYIKIFQLLMKCEIELNENEIKEASDQPNSNFEFFESFF